ncbi:uncharacterized protein LOC127855818 isoform X1 [Dreissena polymorpha]|nr:uncharacterized protein LOC127855818 isoform X1 [Dreissena polymorpha]
MSDGKNNDAAILNHMLKTNIDDIRGLLREGDVFVVDRGFRDALPLLKDLGINAEMPAIMQKGEKQLTTGEANASRLVTKIRWVVESANARIKRFKYLDHVMPNSQLPFIGDFVRIVCAISNKYFPPLSSPDQVEQDELIAQKMLQQNEKENELKMLVEEKGLARKKTIWRPIEDCEVQGFPRLSDEQLSELTLGVYQLRLSSSYMQEHTTGNCDIKVHVHEQSLISAKLQSRYTSSRRYMLWIRHSEDMVESWYCQCKTGSRVVGMCSHIAAVVWFLSAGRYQQKESLGVRDWGKYLSDASAIRIDDSSSSESDSEVF